jgi:hypothetical protein
VVKEEVAPCVPPDGEAHAVREGDVGDAQAEERVGREAAGHVLEACGGAPCRDAGAIGLLLRGGAARAHRGAVGGVRL